MSEVKIRNAATVILVRGNGQDAAVLMGQRGKSAVFMPSKFVFPGGAVDADDAQIPLNYPVSATCQARLQAQTDPALAKPLMLAAIREMWEETGHALGRKGHPPQVVPQAWQSFYEQGLVPDASALTFIFRAITPPGRPRRFDARFFLGRAELIQGDPDDFSLASDELSHLQWVPLSEARKLDMPFITEVVLAEVQNRLTHPDTDHKVPFFSQDGDAPIFAHL